MFDYVVYRCTRLMVFGPRSIATVISLDEESLTMSKSVVQLLLHLKRRTVHGSIFVTSLHYVLNLCK